MIDIRAKVHDKFSVEFKISFVVRRKLEKNNFAINTWIFVPNSLDMDSSTYSKVQFYSDVKSNIRLITPVFLLREIASGSAVPLHNIQKAFNEVSTNSTRTVVREYEYQIKMFMTILKSSIRDEVIHIKGNALHTDVEYLCKKYLESINTIITEYRNLRKIINTPKVSADSLDYFLFGDEFMSSTVEGYTFSLIKALESRSKTQFSETISELKNLIRGELNYKKEKGLLTFDKESSTNNKELIFRYGVLKKYIDSGLFLKFNRKKDGVVVEQIYYSLAAAISMIFATVIAFSFQQKFGNFTTPLFVALVLSYMGKDRIKELMRFYFAHKLGTKYFDNKTTIRVKDIPIGWSKEAVDFITDSKVPREVMELRSRSTLLEAENRLNNEKIILYRKRMLIDREKMELDSKYLVTGINDIIRFHVNRFIQKMDNPKIPISTLNHDDTISVIKGDKIYYLNFIMQLQFEEKLEYKRFRVVVSRSGIMGIEKFSI